MWGSWKSKLKGMREVRRRGYRGEGVRRIDIKKSKGKLGGLGIGRMKERGMEGLYVVGLEGV